jgi:hypothetical protein
MGLPMTPNTTCDVYHVGHAPPSAPDLAAVPCYLVGDYGRRMEAGESESAIFRYTHVMWVDAATDIRDDFVQWGGRQGQGDVVYVPDKNGTIFDVVHVEIKNRGTPAAVRKVYLDRSGPNWPTNNL